MGQLRTTLVQLDGSPDRERNLGRIRELLYSAPPADLIALPEVFGTRGNHDDYVAAAEPLNGATVAALSDLAREHNAWILGGSIIERDADNLYNTAVLLNRNGDRIADYRKIHLFEAALDTGEVIRERDTYLPGAEPRMAQIEEWSCGLSICYDVRFPELYRAYASRGAHLLAVPANFTQRTGRDHWETLLRARAIENQCFVVAPNQCGTNIRTGVASHGHSMIIDPWGDVLGVAGDEEGLVHATLDLAHLESIRKRVPALDHRRL